MAGITPMKAIRAKCLQCTCNQRQEIKLCTIKTCALYPYRMGHRPKDEDNIVESISEPENEDTAVVI